VDQDSQPIIESYHPKQGNILRRHLTKEGQNTVLVAGRGFGKSILGRGIAVLNALHYRGYVPPRSKTKMFNVIAMPLLNQCKKVHLAPLEYLFTETSLSKIVKNINRSEGVIELKGDRPGIILAGLNDEGLKLRGLSIPRLIIDEFGDIKPSIWASVKPAVDRINGCVLTTGTPKGKATHFYRFTKKMTQENAWKYYHYVTKDNPYLPDVERILREAKAGLTEKEYLSEYFASWEDFPGQVFDSITNKSIKRKFELPKHLDQVFLGVDWGDYSCSCVVVGVTDFPYKYHVLDYFEGNPDGGGSSISFDTFLRTCGELANQYNVSATFPDVFQPGNVNFINEFRASEYQGLRNTVDPLSEDYKRMRSLKVMPSLSQMNRLFYHDRLYILDTMEDNFRSIVRKKDPYSEFFLDEVDKSSTRFHLCDSLRYVVSNVENTLAILCGHNYLTYGSYNN
jgi:hypothetical protein